MLSNDPWELQQLVERYKFRCEVLEAEITKVKDELAYIKGEDLKYLKAYVFFKLTKKEYMIFCALMHRNLVPHSEIMNFVYSLDIEDPPHEEIIKVFVCKMRAKLRKHGIDICTKWGLGYYITEGNKDRVKNLLESFSGLIEDRAS